MLKLICMLQIEMTPYDFCCGHKILFNKSIVPRMLQDLVRFNDPRS